MTPSVLVAVVAGLGAAAGAVAEAAEAAETSLAELVVLAGAVVTALGIIAGGLTWLLRPRVETYLTELVGSVQQVSRQLDDRTKGTTADNARRAAEAAEALPQLVDDVRALAGNQADLSDQLRDLAAGQRDLDDWRGRTDNRLGAVESAVVALLGPELRRRLDLDPAPQHHVHHLDPDRVTDRPPHQERRHD